MFKKLKNLFTLSKYHVSAFKRFKNLLMLSKYHVTPCNILCCKCGANMAGVGVLCSEKNGFLYADQVAFDRALQILTVAPCDACKEKDKL